MCILTFLLLEVFQASSPILQANEIAHRLRISPKTVELHRSNIAKKDPRNKYRFGGPLGDSK